MIEWHGLGGMKSRSYICGYCGTHLASDKGWTGNENVGGRSITHQIYICHVCSQPTYFNTLGQFPGAPFGQRVNSIPTDIEQLYSEARNSVSVNAFTGSVLCSRKLLMNIAVSKGASEGQSFAQYVDYLAAKGYVPPDGKEWVDHIRKKGNEATHEIAIMIQDDAKELITFVETLLKFIYEYPGMISGKKNGK